MRSTHAARPPRARPRRGRPQPDHRRRVTAGIDFALRLVAEIAGEGVAKAIQLGLEYDPAPPFASGHPDVADPALVAQLRARYAAVTGQLTVK